MTDLHVRIVCPVCDTVVLHEAGTPGRRPIYCSRSCAKKVASQRYQARRAGRDPDEAARLTTDVRVEVRCEYCGTPFSPKATGRPPRYCKKSCANLASRMRAGVADLELAALTAEARHAVERFSRLTGTPIPAVFARAVDCYMAGEEWRELQAKAVADLTA